MRISRFIAAVAVVLGSVAAHALEVKAYTPSDFAQAQANEQPVVLHFHADWCPTCRAQDKVLQSMLSHPGLDVTVLVVDYDNERALRRRFNVRTQSTFVVLHGESERARLVGVTDEAQIRAAFESAL